MEALEAMIHAGDAQAVLDHLHGFQQQLQDASLVNQQLQQRIAELEQYAASQEAVARSAHVTGPAPAVPY